MHIIRKRHFFLPGVILLAMVAVTGGCAQNLSMPDGLYGGVRQSDDEVARRVYEAVNRFRESQNLAPLKREGRLDRVAQDYCLQMIRENHFAHESLGGQRPEDRLERAGIDDWTAAGENLARNRNARDPVDAAVRGWEISPGHLENLLEKRYRRCGVAAVTDDKTGYLYVVQMYLD